MLAFSALAASTSTACGTVAGEEYGAPTTPTGPVPTYQLTDPRPVTEVVDGDTFEVNLDGTATRVRMKGLDTPELNLATPANDPEPWAEEARAFTLQHIGTHISLEYDTDCDQNPLVQCRDTYDRLLAYVRLSDGSDLAARLLSAGLARVFAFQNEQFDRRGPYETLQSQAQTQNVGIWSD